MNRQPEFLAQREVWAKGRETMAQFLGAYRRKYPHETPPPPAIAIREIVPEILGARLFFEPLPLNVYGQTQCRGGLYCVTINALIRLMPNVQDVEGIENVCLCHEAMHIVEDKDLLDQGPTLPFEGFDPSPTITCFRSIEHAAGRDDRSRREFRAEEAGRAAAVSIPHLLKVQAFADLIGLGRRGQPVGGKGWSLLYAAAKAIGVNRSAAVRQLQLEGWIAVDRTAGSNTLLIQSSLVALAETGA